MIEGIERRLDWLLDHYVVVCLFLALITMTVIKVGNVMIVGVLGLLLCAVGMAQRAGKADPWILLPLILYNLFSAASSYRTFGNVVEGFASTQIIFPVVYLLTACVDGRERLLLRKLCAMWAAAAACLGLGQFVCQAMDGGYGRLEGILGNPNALGIFLVLGWFILADCGSREEGEVGRTVTIRSLEPFLLTAIALTLSMGSFVSMAAGILALLICRKKEASWGETFRYGSLLLAKATLGIGMGILMYLGADRTAAPGVCVILLIYIMTMAWLWEKLDRYLKTYQTMAVLISAMGFVVAAAAVAVRPNSVATLRERLEMMQNGVGYFLDNPLFGVGPYQWRLLNLYDSDKYFNTYHIHNAFVHVGAEMGAAAAAMMLIIAVRCFLKKKSAAQYAGCAAFLCHNLIDTGFFYVGIVSMALVMAGEPDDRGKAVGFAATKVLFGVFGAAFAWNLWWYIRMV